VGGYVGLAVAFFTIFGTSLGRATVVNCSYKKAGMRGSEYASLAVNSAQSMVSGVACTYTEVLAALVFRGCKLGHFGTYLVVQIQYLCWHGECHVKQIVNDV
jgi:hypothetical protein